MSLKEIQKQVDEITSQYKLQYWKPHEVLAHLMEEFGELAREISCRFGPKNKKPAEDTKEIGDEIADILFALCCLANPLKIDLDEAFKRMTDKLQKRDYNRYKRKINEE